MSPAVAAVRRQLRPARHAHPYLERMQYPHFDWTAYLVHVPMLQKQVLQKLDITDQVFFQWKKQKRIPVAVWLRCVRYWGTFGTVLKSPIRTERAFRLAPSYASEGHDPQIPLERQAVELAADAEDATAALDEIASEIGLVEVPEIASRPVGETVPWDVHTLAVRVALDQVHEEMIRTELHRRRAEALEHNVKVLEHQNEELRLKLATQPVNVTLPVIPAAALIATMRQATGEHPALSELETRLQKETGQIATVTRAGREDFAKLAPESKSAVVKAIKVLHENQKSFGLRFTTIPDGHRLTQQYGATAQIRASKAVRILLTREASNNGHQGRWQIVRIMRRGDKDLWQTE